MSKQRLNSKMLLHLPCSWLIRRNDDSQENQEQITTFVSETHCNSLGQPSFSWVFFKLKWSTLKSVSLKLLPLLAWKGISGRNTLKLSVLVLRSDWKQLIYANKLSGKGLNLYFDPDMSDTSSFARLAASGWHWRVQTWIPYISSTRSYSA